nr:hypothetical protein [Corynebacterium macginleyi]
MREQLAYDADVPLAFTSPRPAAENMLRCWFYAALVAVAGTTIRLSVLAAMAAAQGDSLWGLLNKWDAEYYVDIARAGYIGADGAPSEETTLAFFPGFPLVVRAVSNLLGADVAGTAMALNFFFTIALSAGVMALARQMGMGTRGQVLGATVVSSAPMSIVFAMPYTEALFGALAMWAVVMLHDQRWIMAGVLIFLAAFVRLTAVNLIVVFAIMVFLQARRSWWAWLSVVVSALPLVGYIWWANRHLSGAGGYFGLQEKHWNSGFDGGRATVSWVAETLTSATNGGYLLSAAVIIAAPICLLLAWGRLPLPAWLFAAGLMANVLLSDGIMHSRPRLLLPAAVVLVPWVVKKGASASVAVGAWVLFGAWFSAYMLAVFEWAI